MIDQFDETLNDVFTDLIDKDGSTFGRVDDLGANKNFDAGDFKAAFRRILTKSQQYSGGPRVYDPKDYGAVGGALGAKKGGSYDVNTMTFSAVDYNGDTIDFRKHLKVGDIVGYQGTERRIAGFDINGNIYHNGAPMNVNNVLWYAGSAKDTAGIQAAIDAAIAAGGGVVNLGSDNYLVGLSQAEYDAGKTSALLIDKPSGVPLAIMGHAHSQHVTRLIWRWNISNEQGVTTPSVGDCIGNKHGRATDFVCLSNFAIDGIGFAVGGSTRKTGIRFVNPFGGGNFLDNQHFVSTDCHCRIYNVTVGNTGEHGVWYTGRGEFHIEHCNIGSTAEYGIFMNDTYDNKIINCTIAATGKTGLRFEGGSSSSNIIGGKIFYIGKNGGSDEADSAAIAFVNSQWRSGVCQIQNVNLQEIRGSGLYCHNSGGIIYDNIISQGIGRQTINDSNLPAIIADVRISGDFSRGIRIGVISYGFPLFANQLQDNGGPIRTYGNKTHMLYIPGATEGVDPDDGVTVRVKGPEDIFGWFRYMTPEVRSDFRMDFGTGLSQTTAPGGVVVLGGNNGVGATEGSRNGCTNGRNTGLLVNNVPLT